MRIKQIDIIGFKSFVDKVSLPFQEGVNVVVGPNGCGKSNILDAIRWVMGEQSAKTLRGSSMEDVIFKGSVGRTGLGMAEVSLTLAAEDGTAPEPYRECAEIMVTRRLFRDGESEYYINKSRCRRSDIQELFLDTGVGSKSYSFIEQGNIETILSAKPEDRRSLIEDAAGVMKFKVRKKAALRKIEAARLNLTRLEDLIGEVRRQSAGLKRQAQKAERFREYRQELKGIEIGFARRRFRELQGEETAISGAEAAGRASLEQLEQRLRTQDQELEALKAGQRGQEQEIQEARGALLRLAGELDKTRERLEFNRREAERTERDRERLLQERRELEQRTAALAVEQEQAGAGLGALDKEIAAGEQEMEVGVEKAAFLQEAEQRQAGALNALREKLFACLGELARFANLREEAEKRLETLDHRLRRNREEAAGQEQKLRELERDRERAVLELAASRARRGDLEARLADLEERRRRLEDGRFRNREQLALLREEQAALRSRLQALAEMDGRAAEQAGGGVPVPAGVRRKVADCLAVPKEQERLFESFLGSRLQALMVGKEASSKEVLAWSRGLGRENRLYFPAAAAAFRRGWEGGIPLRELAGAGPDRELVENLLEGAFRVESLDPFLEGHLPAGVTLVTDDGEILSWRGELLVGYGTGTGAGVLARRRMRRELEGALREQEAAQARQEHQRQTLEAEGSLLESEFRGVEGLLAQERQADAAVERRLGEIDLSLKRGRDRLEVFDLELAQLREEMERLREESGRGLREMAVREQDRNRLQEQLGSAQQDFDDFRREVERIREGVTQAKVRQAGQKERRRALAKRLEEGGKALAEGRDRLVRLQERLADSDREQVSGQGRREELEAFWRELTPRQEQEQKRLAALEAAAGAAGQKLKAAEEQLRSLRISAAREREGLNGLRLRLQEKRLEREHVQAAALERFRCDLEQQPAEGDQGWDDERMEARRLALQRQLETIGEVNLTALEEYRALEERLAFLVGQQDDLTASVADLETTIHRIDATTSRRFREAFDQINGRFQEVFPRLFSGGRAELLLSDEGNLLETGVEIVAQPPGKRLQELGLLSGGEKALTAIALVFATFMVRPSPFCLLDEVDAPLDDANTDRYNGLIQELATSSQFIIITHNKRTMRIGDALYGITMEEQGVSKVVSVRINDFR
ncbi:MAG: chromosome segregation protein SMC [Deltaproteobacteria bacterium]|nr:chromosome segregation protein SMC [Deltaproteobacteria bacterium]